MQPTGINTTPAADFGEEELTQMIEVDANGVVDTVHAF